MAEAGINYPWVVCTYIRTRLPDEYNIMLTNVPICKEFIILSDILYS